MDETQTTRPLTLEANLGLVRRFARRYARLAEGVATFEELYHEGVLGLDRAIKGFEPDKGYKFSTYAWWQIRGAMSHYLRDKCSPGGLRGIPRGRGRLSILSLDVCYGEYDGIETLVDVLPAPDDRKHWLIEILNQLPEENREVVIARYFWDMKAEEIAKHYGISRATILRRQKQAFRLMRKYCE